MLIVRPELPADQPPPESKKKAHVFITWTAADNTAHNGRMVCNEKVNFAEFMQKIEIFDRKLVSKHTGGDICAGSVTLSRWKQNSEGKTKFMTIFSKHLLLLLVQ